MVFLFKDKSDLNLIFLLLLSLALHFHVWTNPPLVIANESDGLLSYFLLHYIKALPPLVLFFLFHTILLSQAIRLNILLSNFKMFQQISYIPAFTYVILTAMFPYWDVISAGLIANSLVIWILVKLLRLYDQNQPKTLEFNIGLILGLSIILYEPIAILIPVVLFALLIIRPFKLAEWLVLIMGILLPFYFIFTYVFLTGNINDFRTTGPLYYSGEKILGGIFSAFNTYFFSTHPFFSTSPLCLGYCDSALGQFYQFWLCHTQKTAHPQSLILGGGGGYCV